MKKNLPIIIGVTLPIIFILLISLLAFGPTWSIKPAHNFIYSHDNRDYYYGRHYRNEYDVEGGKVVMKSRAISKVNQENVTFEDAPPLFLYNVSNNSTHEIGLAETMALNLDPGPTSPDGYLVEYRSGNYGVFELFGSNNSVSGYYMTKDQAGKKLPGFQNDRYGGYDSNFKFLGWVK